MSNMLYACRLVQLSRYASLFSLLNVRISILYKTKLPFIIVFNKTDVAPHQFALDWMQDFEVFQRALVEHGAQGGAGHGDGDPTYMDSLMSSMSMVLDEFYKHLTVCLST